MPPRVFLLRHGRSVANEKHLIASTLPNAKDAYGLTPLGREQIQRTIAQALAAGMLGSPVQLVSSPLLRARESIAIAAEVLDATPTVDARLSERNFGEFELQPDDHYDQVWARDQLDATHELWGVESVVKVLARAGQVVREITGDTSTESVILCTHGDVASTLLCSSLGLPLEQHREVGALETGDMRELGGRGG